MVMSDLGDNAGAGGPVNTLWMLEALHEASSQHALIVNFRDRHVVQAAQDAASDRHSLPRSPATTGSATIVRRTKRRPRSLPCTTETSSADEGSSLASR